MFKLTASSCLLKNASATTKRMAVQVVNFKTEYKENNNLTLYKPTIEEARLFQHENNLRNKKKVRMYCARRDDSRYWYNNLENWQREQSKFSWYENMKMKEKNFFNTLPKVGYFCAAGCFLVYVHLLGNSFITTSRQ